MPKAKIEMQATDKTWFIIEENLELEVADAMIVKLRAEGHKVRVSLQD